MSAESSENLVAETIVIVGVGLLGGSLAAALKRRKLVRRVIGVGRRRERIQLAEDLQLIDHGVLDVAEAAEQADLIVYCTPVGEIAAGVRRAAQAAKRPLLVTDVGSTKVQICKELAQFADGRTTFVGSHPLAGSEKQGCEFADSDLFVGRLALVTPMETTPASTVRRIQRMWQSVGSHVREISPGEHDRALARTSHVPHLVASALAGALESRWLDFTARGFRDTTRIAAGDPELWRHIALSNREAILEGLIEVKAQIENIERAIIDRDAPALEALLRHGKEKRDAIEVSHGADITQRRSRPI